MTDRQQQLAASFDRAADVYERARPSYPADFVAWAMRDHPRAVLDLGAGTGKLTRLLDAETVYAVDPSERMLQQLTQASPEVDASVGTAESIPLPDASVDLVTCAQAWHWVDPATAIPEVKRVLVPGGELLLVWNYRDDRVPWVAQLTAAMHPSNAEIWLTDPALPEGEVEEFDTSWEMPFTRESLRELVLSRSYVISASEAERASILAAVDAVIDANPESAGVMPYRTRAYRIRLAR